MGLGIVGCGNIFESYMTGLRKLGSVRVLGCADVDQARSEAAAKFHDLAAYDSVEALLEDDSVEIVVNLTPPSPMARSASPPWRGAKNVFSEKPLAASFDEAGLVMAGVAAAPAAWAVRPTHSSPAPARPPGRPSTQDSSGSRSASRPPYLTAGPRTGTRTRHSSSKRGAAPFWTWARTTCRTSSIVSVR